MSFGDICVLQPATMSSCSEAVKHTRSSDAASPSSLCRCPVTDVTGPPTATLKPSYINTCIITVVFLSSKKKQLETYPMTIHSAALFQQHNTNTKECRNPASTETRFFKNSNKETVSDRQSQLLTRPWKTLTSAIAILLSLIGNSNSNQTSERPNNMCLLSPW